MTCTHYDITGKFNYFRHLRVKNEDGTFGEQVRCFQCSAKFIPKPEEKGECCKHCLREGCPEIPCPCKCHKKANQGTLHIHVWRKIDDGSPVCSVCGIIQEEYAQSVNDDRPPEEKGECRVVSACLACGESSGFSEPHECKKANHGGEGHQGAFQKPSETSESPKITQEEREWRRAVVGVLGSLKKQTGEKYGYPIWEQMVSKHDLERLLKFL